MRKKKYAKRSKKECIYCGERILEKAIKCRYCGSTLINNSALEELKDKENNIFQERNEKGRKKVHVEENSNVSEQQKGKNIYHLQAVQREDNSFCMELYPKAPLIKRVAAIFIDGLILSIAFLPLFIWILAGNPLFPAEGLNPASFEAAHYLGTLLLFFGIMWALIYGLTRDGWGKGQSPGKRIMGLMVINLKRNLPCTKGRSLLRQVFIILGFIVEPLFILFHSRGKRIGDIVAGTQVIEKVFYWKDTPSLQEKLTREKAFIS